jgi:hypothetical protein
MKKLSIITQNLDNKIDEQGIKDFFNAFNADIYAFQEFKRNRCGIVEIFTRPTFNDYIELYHGNESERRIANLFFPWLDFKSGYEVIRRIQVIRFLFGMKKRTTNSSAGTTKGQSL